MVQEQISNYLHYKFDPNAKFHVQSIELEREKQEVKNRDLRANLSPITRSYITRNTAEEIGCRSITSKSLETQPNHGAMTTPKALKLKELLSISPSLKLPDRTPEIKPRVSSFLNAYQQSLQNESVMTSEINEVNKSQSYIKRRNTMELIQVGADLRN